MIKNKKVLYIALTVAFSVFIGTKIAFSYSFIPQFAGRIIYTKALEIQELEMTGFTCFVPGSTIEIKPIGSPINTPTSYLIPFGTRSKTKYGPRAGQLIMGKYSAKTIINCINSATGVTKMVNLDTITLFGTSR